MTKTNAISDDKSAGTEEKKHAENRVTKEGSDDDTEETTENGISTC